MAIQYIISTYFKQSRMILLCLRKKSFSVVHFLLPESTKTILIFPRVYHRNTGSLAAKYYETIDSADGSLKTCELNQKTFLHFHTITKTKQKPNDRQTRTYHVNI